MFVCTYVSLSWSLLFAMSIFPSICLSASHVCVCVYARLCVCVYMCALASVCMCVQGLHVRSHTNALCVCVRACLNERVNEYEWVRTCPDIMLKTHHILMYTHTLKNKSGVFTCLLKVRCVMRCVFLLVSISLSFSLILIFLSFSLFPCLYLLISISLLSHLVYSPYSLFLDLSFFCLYLLH